MRALARKRWRDLARWKVQALAIALILACGVAMVVMSACALVSLEEARDRWNDRAHLADVFASLVRAPAPVATRIAEVPGVVRVATRVVKDVTLDVPGLREPAVGRLVSIPEIRVPGLNEIHLRRGRWIEPDRPEEVLVHEAFALAQRLELGGGVAAVINGRRRNLRVVGVALSPEHIFPFRPGDVLPDDRHFGVFWMSERHLAAAFDMEGAFNDVALDLAPAASVEEVVRRVDLLLEPYGSTGAYGRHEQMSQRFVGEEMRQLEAMATVPPAIFLAVAAFLLHVVLARTIATQRTQIAVLRAFGFRRREVVAHYVGLVLVIAAVGVVLGLAAGMWMGAALTRMYASFYRFPVFDVRVPTAAIVVAVGASVGAALLGTLSAVLRAARLPPAEGMRPEPVPRFRPSLVERLGLARLLSPAGRMVVRQMERRPLRTVLSLLAIALASAVMVLGSFTGDSVDHVIDLRFHAMDRSDVLVTLETVASSSAEKAFARLPGVRAAQAIRDVPVRLRSGSRALRSAIHGMEPEGDLFRLLDVSARPVAVREGALVLSERAATRLGVAAGDSVDVEVLEGARPRRALPVSAVFDDVAGPTAYAPIDTVRRLLGEGDTSTGAYLAVDAARLDDLYRAIKDAPRVAGTSAKRSALERFDATLAANLRVMQAATLAFAIILALGVVHNTSRVALAERSRDLATLRVLGFTRAEVSGILLGEQAILTLAAVPLGLWIGRGFAEIAMAALATQDYRFPAVISPATYGLAAAVTILCSVVSGWTVRRRLERLDVVGALRAPE